MTQNKAKPDQEAPLRAILGIVHAHHFRGGKWGKSSGSRLSTISKFASVQFLYTLTPDGYFRIFGQNKVTKMCLKYILTRYYK